MTDPGAPHILENLLSELIWSISFLLSLGFGLYQIRSARAYEQARVRLKANGAARLESKLLMRRALIRVGVSLVGSGVGLWALLTPDTPVSNQFILGGFVVLAVGYASPVVLEVVYARRQLKILRSGKHDPVVGE